MSESEEQVTVATGGPDSLWLETGLREVTGTIQFQGSLLDFGDLQIGVPVYDLLMTVDVPLTRYQRFVNAVMRFLRRPEPFDSKVALTLNGMRFDKATYGDGVIKADFISDKTNWEQ